LSAAYKLYSSNSQKAAMHVIWLIHTYKQQLLV